MSRAVSGTSGRRFSLPINLQGVARKSSWAEVMPGGVGWRGTGQVEAAVFLPTTASLTCCAEECVPGLLIREPRS